MDYKQIEEFLQGISIFNSLETHQIRNLARKVGMIDFHAGDRIINQGDEGLFFFILFNGQVSSSHVKRKNETQVDMFFPGDFFGEEALLSRQTLEVTVTAITEGTLLYLSKEKFLAFLEQYPQIKTALIRAVNSFRFIRKHKFDWLGDDEVIYQVRRKHPAYLLVAVLPPLILLIISLLVGTLGIASTPASTFSLPIFILAGIFSAVALIWGLWVWLDWANDNYIVTNRRVLWIEKIMLIYESRMEAPLDTILAINQNSNYIGRILGYGNVIVKTYTGQIPMRAVGEPGMMAALVEEHWNRAKLGVQRQEEEVIERSIRQRFVDSSGEADIKEQDSKYYSNQEKDQDLPNYQEPSLRDTYFGNIFTVRIEEENSITFRKHWIVLFKKSWLPSIGVLAVFLALLVYDVFQIAGKIQHGSPIFINGVAILILFLFLFPWWLYNYIDWRNDIYQVTDKNIFDIDRKPFGQESRKSAPLENILSLEHERPGFLGYILNFGNVTINVGEVKFVFQGVYEPARVQQDIFDRMYLLRKKREQKEIERERDRMLTVLDSYHRNIGNIQDQ